uniref:hypothetical protein n=1 Tax=Aquitalea magnusonii TaxID=332411 RepID=UPI00195C6D9C
MRVVDVGLERLTLPAVTLDATVARMRAERDTIAAERMAWQVPADATHITRFLRAVQNQPEEAARQIATFAGSAMETGSSGFALSSLVNTDASQLRISQLEQRLRQQL